jgi:hypothetical protein
MTGTIVAFPAQDRAATAAQSDDITAWRNIGNPAARAARLDAAAGDALTKPIHSLCCARRQLDDAARIAGPHHRTTTRFRTLLAMLDDLIEDMCDLQTSLKPTREA